jgi:ABC-type transport system involved in multi-copper enzyme maturation permease subunit
LLNAVLLQTAFYCITLFFSILAREAGRVSVIAVLIAVISYLVNVIATLWTKAKFIRPYSLHTYYDPQEILVRSHLATTSIVVLLVCSLIFGAAAFGRFRVRDLP